MSPQAPGISPQQLTKADGHGARSFLPAEHEDQSRNPHEWSSSLFLDGPRPHFESAKCEDSHTQLVDTSFARSTNNNLINHTTRPLLFQNEQTSFAHRPSQCVAHRASPPQYYRVLLSRVLPPLYVHAHPVFCSRPGRSVFIVLVLVLILAGLPCPPLYVWPWKRVVLPQHQALAEQHATRVGG